MMGQPRWLMIVRGILAVLLGILLIAWPDHSARALVMMIGLFMIATGIMALIGALILRGLGWGLGLSGAIVTLLLGLLAFLWPGITIDILVLLVAAWALVLGVIEIITGLVLPGSTIRALTIGLGLISVVLALLLFAAPDVGVMIASWLLGLYFLATGALRLYQATQVPRGARVYRVIMG